MQWAGGARRAAGWMRKDMRQGGPTNRIIGVEIEAPWADTHMMTIQGDALALPFGDHCFDCVVTSPVYGNRFSDHHRARDGSLRRTYTHDLQRMTGDPERTLHPNNSGMLQ